MFSKAWCIDNTIAPCTGACWLSIRATSLRGMQRTQVGEYLFGVQRDKELEIDAVLFSKQIEEERFVRSAIESVCLTPITENLMASKRSGFEKPITPTIRAHPVSQSLVYQTFPVSSPAMFDDDFRGHGDEKVTGDEFDSEEDEDEQQLDEVEGDEVGDGDAQYPALPVRVHKYSNRLTLSIRIRAQYNDEASATFFASPSAHPSLVLALPPSKLS